MKLTLYTLFLTFFHFIGFSQTIQLESFVSGISSPVEITNAGDSRLFVVEKGGVIKILNANGVVNTTAFLTISSLISSDGERGLLGLAFAPDYVTTGRFYINYTNTSGNTVIARYTVSANPDIANTSGTILLTINQPYANHNGGKMAFGQDGFLYISMGDGGSGNDPGDRAQNKSTLLGKILRMDVSGTTYSIPATNPFSSSLNGPNDPRPEIFAIGLRNPWKFAFDKTNGDLWIADVGQGAYEEINKVTGSGTPGDNYGWSCYEGNNHVVNTTGNCPPSGGFNSTIAPISEYTHSSGRCSITGGYIYRGTNYPNFIGKYFFADYCSKEIGILTDTGTGWSMAFQTINFPQLWTTFGEDINGELYIAGGSTIYKIKDSSLSVPKIDLSNIKLFPNPSKSNISIDFSIYYNDIEYISIINALGQKIQKISEPNQQTVNISTENFVSGLYYVEISAKYKLKTIKKFVVN